MANPVKHIKPIKVAPWLGRVEKILKFVPPGGGQIGKPSSSFNYYKTDFLWRFLLLIQPFGLIVFLFSLHFCILSHFEILRCIDKSLISTSTYFLLQYNWKKKTWKVFFWVPEFGCPNWYTNLPSGLNMSLLPWWSVWSYINVLKSLTRT